ncbi:hypothetical protein [Petroclostridium sp. X23]|uniref:hypothetical protein n=1 Tax=Petroclostridium sp. X23 TaxID=3045146 RepID=UPI0024AE158A|nr:hypothetical protein [Petroclostridium sp. X23]WHH60173.1 hypothetical protein QKW49_05410 [Petroclostridium sp. X23]
MKQLNFGTLNTKYAEKNPEEAIRYIVETIGISKIVLASSLSIEDRLLTKRRLRQQKR